MSTYYIVSDSLTKGGMDGPSDSRKRPLDSDNDDGFSKRSNQGSHGDPHQVDDVHFKIMVPSCAAGAIIGVGGTQIGKMQRETNAKIKISKNQDVFPGTTERVCLVVGTIQACRDAHEAIQDLIIDKPDPSPRPGTDGGDKINYDRHKQTKFLIPNMTAGVIIGKGGGYIKEIKERSGANVTVSQKNDNIERIVTVSGDVNDIRDAIGIMLEKLAVDPQSKSCWSLNYSQQQNNSGGANMVGNMQQSGSYTNLNNQPPASQNQNNSAQGGLSMTPQQLQQAAQSLSSMMRGFGSSGMSGVSAPQRPRNPVIDQLVQTLRMTGYTEQIAEEIASALAVLANYGVLGLTSGSLIGNLMNMNRLSLNGSGTTAQSSSSSGNLASSQNNVPSLIGSSNQNQSNASHLSNQGFSSNMGGASDESISLLRQLTETLSRNSVKSDGSNMMFGSGIAQESKSTLFDSALMSYGDFDSGIKNDAQQQHSHSPEQDDKQEIEIAENLAGAIIGQGGRGISEMNMMTGANIQVSKRGVYAPGTNNRIVTITGPVSSVVRAAQLVRTKIQEAEQRRGSSY